MSSKKNCNRCKTEKPLSEFYKDSRRKDGKQTSCISCQKAKSKERREAGLMDKYKGRYTSDNGRKHYSKKRAYICGLRKPCINCGAFDPAFIDFHHIDPSTKSFNLANGHKHSFEAIAEEAKKCCCLCANCHRRLHAGQDIRVE